MLGTFTKVLSHSAFYKLTIGCNIYTIKFDNQIYDKGSFIN